MEQETITRNPDGEFTEEYLFSNPLKANGIMYVMRKKGISINPLSYLEFICEDDEVPEDLEPLEHIPYVLIEMYS
jgi:hypothetical protein